MSKKTRQPILFNEYWHAIAYCVKNSINNYTIIKSPQKPTKYSKSWEGWYIKLQTDKLV